MYGKVQISGTALTNQNCIHEEIKSRLNSGNACYHSVQSLLLSCLLSRNVKVKIYITIILPGVKGVVCGLEGIRLADRCILTKLE
jgi:hypothetical protein